ncbi:Ig-like domain-containing protein [Streptomyces sp. NPDC087440]|uniref:Ig-like domain-containing protein n=1 Tax=Streptomyces sp. NPDC087440 TaxID=3365790 RepID=UPI0038284654
MVALQAAAGVAFTAAPAVAATARCTPGAGFNNCLRYTFSGGDQTFTVPKGSSPVRAKLWGAGGAGRTASSRGGGGGGFTQGTVGLLTAGQKLTVTSGGAGVPAETVNRAYGGGGLAGTGQNFGGAGGGMSAIWAGAYGTTPLLIAGGGGGGSVLLAGSSTRSGGGGGGGTTGADTGVADPGRGGPGQQTTGGAPGTGTNCPTAPTAGTKFRGGNAGFAPFGNAYSNSGGGGGGGWFGGGGGVCGPSQGAEGAGGGGGSAYIGGAGVSAATTTPGGVASGPGTGGAAGGAADPQRAPGIGAGGAQGKGGNGEVVLQFTLPAPVITGPTGTVGDETPTITGTGEPGTVITVRDKNNSPLCTATVQPDRTWSCTATTPIPAGPNSFTATPVDPDAPDATYPSSAPDNVTVAPEADLAMVKSTATTTKVAPGETFAYRLTVTNNGPSVARNVKAGDPLPTPLGFVSSADGCTATGQRVTCGPEATLAVGASRTWTFTVRLDPGYTGDGSDVGNVATATADTGDSRPDNDSNDPVGLPGGGPADPRADIESEKKTP